VIRFCYYYYYYRISDLLLLLGDCIDFTDNEIKKLENIPLMPRLVTLIFNNNYISKIHINEANLPSLKALVLTNNRINNLNDILNLVPIKSLEVLSLLDNPVATKQYYRLFTIYNIPSLKLLDYKKVTKTERDEAEKLFNSSTGKAILSAVDNVTVSSASSKKNSKKTLTEYQKRQISAAIEAAKTAEEIDRIESQIKDGTFIFSENTMDES
jgi:U2 small nuclear ribonucleoprotein A'